MTKAELIAENNRLRMTKAELIEENNRLRASLKEIYDYTYLSPRSETEMKRYDEGDICTIYVGRLGAIAANVEIGLIPDWMYHTREENEAIIASL